MKIALALLLALPALLQDDKVTIKYAPKEGDVVTVVEKMSMEVKIEANGQEFEVTNKGSKKKVMTFLKVTDGKVTKRKDEHVEDVEEGTHPGQMEPTKKENPLHGKTITLMDKDGKTVLEGADDLDEKTAKKLKLKESHAHFFSEKPVGVGDSWEVSGDALKKAMEDEDFEEGKITFKVKEFKEVDKQRCVVLDAKFELKGKTDQGFEISFTAEGPLTVRLDRGMPVAMKLKGIIKIGSEEAGFAGEGPMTVETTATLKE